MPWEEDLKKQHARNRRTCFVNGLMLGALATLIGVGFALSLTQDACVPPRPHVIWTPGESS